MCSAQSELRAAKRICCGGGGFGSLLVIYLALHRCLFLAVACERGQKAIVALWSTSCDGGALRA